MMSAVKKINLPEDLFADQEPDTEVMSAPPEMDNAPPSAEMQALVGKISKRQERRKKSKTIAASTFDKTREEVVAMVKSGEWDECGARHLVALYDIMHLKVYKVEDAALDSKTRYNAVMMAANFVKREFADDYVEAVEYMRWVWSEEMRQEKWRIENNRQNNNPITYYMMFSGRLLTKYRIFLARRHSRA